MASYKRLYRSRDDRMIAGVAGGVGEYFNIDPTLVRILFVVFFLLGGPGLLAYIILWILVPEEPYPGASVVSGSAVEPEPVPDPVPPSEEE